MPGSRIRNDAVFYCWFATFISMDPNAIYRLSEKAITLAWEEKIDTDIHRNVMQIDALIRANPFIGWIENVPAYQTLTIFYDPFQILRKTAVISTFRYVEQCIEAYFKMPRQSYHATAREIRVPVCYEISMGYDLPVLSDKLGLEINEIIRLHSGQRYHVFMLGFLPGFPYMGMLPDALQVQRKPVPATRVPAGTVAIAGQQTGIYPVDSPGGWYAVGRTPVALFNQGQAFFEPGDIVEFYAVSTEEFHQLVNR